MMIFGIGAKAVLYVGEKLAELMRPFFQAGQQTTSQRARSQPPMASITYYPSRKRKKVRAARSQ